MASDPVTVVDNLFHLRSPQWLHDSSETPILETCLPILDQAFMMMYTRLQYPLYVDLIGPSALVIGARPSFRCSSRSFTLGPASLHVSPRAVSA